MSLMTVWKVCANIVDLCCLQFRLKSLLEFTAFQAVLTSVFLCFLNLDLLYFGNFISIWVFMCRYYITHTVHFMFVCVMCSFWDTADPKASHNEIVLVNLYVSPPCMFCTHIPPLWVTQSLGSSPSTKWSGNPKETMMETWRHMTGFYDVPIKFH